MSYYPTSIRNLIKQLTLLPGIGEKTAERLAMHILRASTTETDALCQAIMYLKQNVKLCVECFSLSDSECCQICSDPSRDASTICVVEQPAEMVAIEKGGFFKGKYHVLQGVLSPIEGVGPDQIRIKELISRMKNGNIKEVIIAVSTSVEGESTATYIANVLKPFSVKITRIATGVPMGGDIKYVDQVTLKRALEYRYVI